MVRQYRSEVSSLGPRPATLSKFAATVFAVASMVGTAMAWSWDATSVRFVAPLQNNVDSGTVVTPSAVVRNLGDSTASFPVVFSITPDYADTVQVDSLVSGDSLTLTFADWTAHVRGATTAACSTALAADESTANDRISRNFNVRVRDVSADSIFAPKGNVNLGVALTPQAKVTNHGTGSANFQAKLRIGTLYSESTFVMNLAAGTSRTVNFSSWTPDSLGTFAVVCTVAQNGDTFVVDNNLVVDSCNVITLAKDAGVMRVVAPRGIVDSGAVLAPQAMIRNYGTDVISFPVIFTIGGTYADTEQITDLDPLDSALLRFDEWTAGPVGMITTRCSTALADDSNPVNDARSDSVQVIIRMTDAGAFRIIAPADTVDSGSVVTPQAWVRNFGLGSLPAFAVRMRIGGAYADTAQVDSLAAGDSMMVSFGDYTVARRGTTPAACSTMLTGDQDPANNVVSKTVFRRVRNVGVVSISAPTGVVPKDTVVIPAATLQNLGNTTDSFPVIFRIGTFYEDTVITNDSMVAFRPCTLNVAGTSSVVCSTAMTGDLIPANDVMFDSVQVTDVGISGDEPARGSPRTVTLRATGPRSAGGMSIEYGLPRSADIRLEVYDACGKLVQVVVSGVGQPGYHTVVWQCTDGRGRAVAQGAYFVRLTADGVTITGKMVKLD